MAVLRDLVMNIDDKQRKYKRQRTTLAQYYKRVFKTHRIIVNENLNWFQMFFYDIFVLQRLYNKYYSEAEELFEIDNRPWRAYPDAI